MEKKEYTVLKEYKEEQVLHKVGNTVTLSEEKAKPLLDEGSIGPKEAEKPKEKEKPTKKSYSVIKEVEFVNGDVAEVGSEVELTEEEAVPLLEQGYVEEKE